MLLKKPFGSGLPDARLAKRQADRGRRGMARSKSSASGAGYLFLLVIGAIIYLADVAYKFVVANEAVVLAVGGIAVGGWLVHRFRRPKQAKLAQVGAGTKIKPTTNASTKRSETTARQSTAANTRNAPPRPSPKQTVTPTAANIGKAAPLPPPKRTATATADAPNKSPSISPGKGEAAQSPSNEAQEASKPQRAVNVFSSRLFDPSDIASITPPKAHPAFSVDVVALNKATDVRHQKTGWIDPGRPVQFGNKTVTSGMFYLGKAVPLPGGGLTDQYVINPHLHSKAAHADVSGQSMPYWPSYASINPAARMAFLEWMAEGRVGTEYGIGYVFLFFYGLEHRLFVEGAPDAAQVVIPEVERLLSIYGANNSFRGYANNFLLYGRIACGIPLSSPQLSAERNHSTELDPATRLYLGEKLSRSDKLSSHDTLLWILRRPDTYLRTPAIRCFDEFVALWNIRFKEKFPDGFKVTVRKQSIGFTYRAASGAFQIDIPGPHSKLPDVVTARQSLEPLRKIIQACTEELESFSRFVGKHADQRATIEAASLLPAPLRTASHVAFRSASEQLSKIMGERNTATTQCNNILSAVGIDCPEHGKLTKLMHDRLTQSLDVLDIAIEPDRRYGGAVAQLDDQVVIFRAEKGGAIDASKPAYQAKKVEVEVAALAAAADGDASLDELQAIIANIKATPDLSRIERLRLIAYTITIFKSPPKRARIMRRLTQLSDEQRRDIATAAKSIILKPDKIDPGEVRFFERLHKTLGLPQEQVYSDIHRAAAASDEPVVIASESRAAGVPIPREPKPGVHIDPTRLATIQQQTKQVSNLLSQIFVDDEAQEEQATPAPADASAFEGLDRDHAELVEFLDMNGEMTRNEFDERARSLNLLPDGAIETINEWSFDHFDEPLLEDGEHVVIAADLKKRLAELRASET